MNATTTSKTIIGRKYWAIIGHQSQINAMLRTPATYSAVSVEQVTVKAQVGESWQVETTKGDTHLLDGSILYASRKDAEDFAAASNRDTREYLGLAAE